MTSASLAPTRLPLSLARPRRASSAGAARGLRTARTRAPVVPQAFHNGEHLEMRGVNKWKGNDHLDRDLRATILMYGELAEATYDSFIGDPSSRFFGKNRFDNPTDLLEKTLLPTSLARARRYSLDPDRKKSYIYATEGAYRLSSDSIEGNPPRDRIADVEKKNWIGYIAVSEPVGGLRDVVIAFRGTITKGEWETNVFGDRLESCNLAQQRAGIKVHAGFGNTYWMTDKKMAGVDAPRKTVGKALEAILREYKTEIGSVTVTGHSLGGALATLAAYDVALRLRPGNRAKGIPPGAIRAKLANDEVAPVEIRDNIHVSAITFASPRVGNPAFKAALEKAEVPVLRVVNYRDVVPLVPGILSTAVTKTLFLAGIDARAPGDGMGTVLKGLNWALSKVPKLGDWAYEHTDPELLFYSDDITYDEQKVKDNSQRPMRALGIKDVGPRHNLEVYLYMVAVLRASSKKGGAIKRDPTLMNKGDWCLESKWLLEQGFPDTPKCWYQPLYKLALLSMTIPIGSVQNERSFSRMNLIKTELRNRLEGKHLNVAMRVARSRHTAATFPFKRAFSLWKKALEDKAAAEGRQSRGRYGL
ncbi:hypothetical protein N2152v2_007014 [Parachlorella kessleri]